MDTFLYCETVKDAMDMNDNSEDRSEKRLQALAKYLMDRASKLDFSSINEQIADMIEEFNKTFK